VANLFRQKLVPSELIDVLECLAQERVEGFACSVLVDRIGCDDKSSYVEHSHIFVITLVSFFEQIGVVHLFAASLKSREGLVHGD
jgi:hypothetical protein